MLLLTDVFRYNCPIEGSRTPRPTVRLARGAAFNHNRRAERRAQRGTCDDVNEIKEGGKRGAEGSRSLSSSNSNK